MVTGTLGIDPERAGRFYNKVLPLANGPCNFKITYLFVYSKLGAKIADSSVSARLLFFIIYFFSEKFISCRKISPKILHAELNKVNFGANMASWAQVPAGSVILEILSIFPGFPPARSRKHNVIPAVHDCRII